jgi:SAM-dependent methyltransferase
MTEPGTYDTFVDWGKRLAREAPFFEREFAEHDVHAVIDVGCGTGMLPILWATRGLDVIGVDPDPGMLEGAVRNAMEEDARITLAGGAVRFERAGFGELGALGTGLVDAVTCTGNALPHTAGRAALAPTLADFASVLRPGGLVVLHLLNHDRLLATRLRAIPPVVRDTEDGKRVFLRFMDYTAEGILMDFVKLHRPLAVPDGAEPWEVSSDSSLHTSLPSDVLEAGLYAAGFGDVRMYGSHAGADFRPLEDESAIVTAVRTA